MEEDYSSSLTKIRHQDAYVFGLLERETEAYGNATSTCMTLLIMYKLFYFLTLSLSLLTSNANKRAVKTYEVEVSVRKALLITLHAAQRGSRCIAVLCPNLGVRWGMGGHRALDRV
jgi:hypothetical protein